MIRLFIPGEPRAQGSMNAVPRTGKDGRVFCSVFHSTDKKLRAWRDLVGIVAKGAMRGRKPLEGPIVLDLVFVRERPKGHWAKSGLSKAGREAIAPATMPDLDKYVRALGDALTGVCFADDGQIVGFGMGPWKVYAPRGARPGVAVGLRPAVQDDIDEALRFAGDALGVDWVTQESMAL